MRVIELKEIGEYLSEQGMIVKWFKNRESITAHFPLNSENEKAITIHDHGDMELLYRYGKQVFATIRYSNKERDSWLSI